jgi:alkanesulfonate monooxygenase SsuD/methylene tetrahydromethanopterin reductase-like flavin-dependent oxidoreductase (luciferase family)
MEFELYQAFRSTARGHRPFPQVYAEVFEQTSCSEETGWDSVWLMERHVVGDGYVPAMRTKSIRRGTFALNLNLQHPIRIAEDVAVVDILSKGRLVLGVSAGHAEHEYEGFGIAWEDRPGIMDEGLEILRGC